ncbi:ATP-dependent DNA helicase PcrA [Micrococcus sp. HMSC067E09]|uniref:DNA helicase PcrA n=1 Tax=Micrococcus sp. HMSC067E09 TaxID=1739367 RepID=UPI0008A1D48D|nr:DNA helicase PcrA [Micrococcus sp. HMSC067E09]OFR90948.1 ATP-dependent DNA helicase PcrA [Micrococcus sp. HMSC067E09]
MDDLFAALGRAARPDRRSGSSDPQTALPGLVPTSVTSRQADPEAGFDPEAGAGRRGGAPATGGQAGGAVAPPSPESLVEGLNPQQAAAVQHTGSPLLIVAGAGSGKTRVLTHRIAWLLAIGHARPHEVLAITFTNKAAAEMRERITGLIGPMAQRMWISTFHSSAVRILRNEASAIGLKSTFTIYDSADSLRLVTQIAKAQDLDPKRFHPKGILNKISSLKNELTEADDYAATVAQNDPWGQAVSAVYTDYTARLRQANALDFDDLIGMTVHMFEAFPAILDNYRRRFRHVLVDEYQDTNHAQYRLIRLLAGPAGVPDGVQTPGGELTVVGDSDQSIYAFRGADIRNIVEFEEDFADAATIKLEQNYRSTQTILDAANAVISNNADRRPKSLWTAEGAGEKIVGYTAENESAEAEWIASQIDRLQDEHGVRPKDVAVFYRTNAQSRSLEERLVTRGIPYRVIGGTRFYDRKEIKDALAYLRALVNPDDDINVRRILNEPKRGIGDRAEGAVAAWADRNRIPFFAALRDAENAPGMATRSLKAVRAFVQMMDDLAQVAETSDPATVLEAVLERSGMLAALRESEDLQDESRADNLGELVAVVRSFSASNPEGTLSDFLEQVALVADADQLPAAPDVEGEALAEQQGQVTLMTLHTAKGLEFPVVFLTGMEHGVFPHSRSMTDEKEMAEERRLAYVGLTRARERLHVTRAEVRSLWGQHQYNPPSQFLAEIPEALIDWEREGAVRPGGAQFGSITSLAGAGTSRYAQRFGGSGATGSGRGSSGRASSYGSGVYGSGTRRNDDGPAPRVRQRLTRGDEAKDLTVPTGVVRGQAPRRVSPQREVVKLVPGDRVRHATFGEGSVVGVSGEGDKTVATVTFAETGAQKRLLLRYAPLEKVD